MSDLQVGTSSPGERLLERLLEQRCIVLGRGADRGQIIRGIERLLATSAEPKLQASRIAEWLLTRRDVEELFASDDELAALIRAL
jgi:hypothetical protein